MADAYFELDLPAAPVVMIGDEVALADEDVSDNKVETVDCRPWGLPAPEKSKEGGIGRFFKR